MRRQTPKFFLMLALALVVGCQSPPSLEDLAATPPLPYSVLVTGGGFVAGTADGESPLERTFGSTEHAEAFSLTELVDVMTAGRVFARIAADPLRAPARRELAEGVRRPAAADGAFAGRLRVARRGGHDLLLIVEPVVDGPIDQRGINGQWPITAAVWLLIGLGVVIPDHTFESRATVHAVVCDVYSGREVYRVDLSPTPVNLSLIERSDWLGLLASIVIPPFWIGDDPEAVAERVRRVSRVRLLVEMARRLKTGVGSQAQRDPLARFELQRADDGTTTLRLVTAEGLAQARFRIDGVRLADSDSVRLERELLESVRDNPDGPGWMYAATLPARLAEGDLLQVAVQTVGGRAASSTLGLR